MTRRPATLAPSRAAGTVARWAATWVCAALLFTAPRPADAHTVHRKIGVGYEQSLTSLPDASASDATTPDISASGLLLQYWWRHVGLEALVGGRALIVPGTPVAWAGFLSLGAHYNAFRAPQVNLSAGVRVTTAFSRVVTTTDTESAASETRVGFSVEVPLRAMFFLSDHFALTGSVGPVITLGGSGVNPLTGARNTTTIALFRGGFSGGLGFVVFLR